MNGFTHNVSFSPLKPQAATARSYRSSMRGMSTTWVQEGLRSVEGLRLVFFAWSDCQNTGKSRNSVIPNAPSSFIFSEIQLVTPLHHLRWRRSRERKGVPHGRDDDMDQASGLMTFRIETVARGKLAVFVLSGRIENQAIAELVRLFELQPAECDIVLDLKEVGVIHRDALHFFVGCEANGVKLENCPAYIREWINKEKG